MTDALGTRAVLAVLVPSTNTMVEPDLASLQPPGVTNHTFRFPFPELPASPERLLALAASLESRDWAPDSGSWAYLGGIDKALVRFGVVPEQPS